MGVRLIVGDNGPDSVALYCSTSGVAFGPVFGTEDDAERFLEWLPEDARRYTESELVDKRNEWVAAGKP